MQSQDIGSNHTFDVKCAGRVGVNEGAKPMGIARDGDATPPMVRNEEARQNTVRVHHSVEVVPPIFLEDSRDL